MPQKSTAQRISATAEPDSIGLNPVEIDFSIIPRTGQKPNDFAGLNAVRVRLTLYEELSNRTAKTFA